MRKCKKLIGSIKAKRLLEATQEGHVNLLEELKKIKGCKKQKDTLPATVAGTTGEKEISEESRKEYSALYNSHHDEEAMKSLSEEIEAEVTKDLVLEVNKIMAEVVKLAMRKVKPGKGDVTGSYTSDAIKFSSRRWRPTVHWMKDNFVKSECPIFHFFLLYYKSFGISYYSVRLKHSKFGDKWREKDL